MNDYREPDFYWAVQHIVDTSLKLAETRNALINALWSPVQLHGLCALFNSGDKDNNKPRCDRSYIMSSICLLGRDAGKRSGIVVV